MVFSVAGNLISLDITLKLCALSYPELDQYQDYFTSPISRRSNSVKKQEHLDLTLSSYHFNLPTIRFRGHHNSFEHQYLPDLSSSTET